MAHPSSRQDLYTRVTTRILAELEKGVRLWIKPWSVVRAATKKPLLLPKERAFFFSLLPGVPHQISMTYAFQAVQ